MCSVESGQLYVQFIYELLGLFFIWIVTVLLAVNRYLLKRDIQRSIYILVIFLLSIYVVMVTKKYESYKEQRQRMNYATELIEERDYNFEKAVGGDRSGHTRFGGTERMDRGW